jgi:ribosome-associated protein
VIRNKDALIKELNFKAIRSSGAGGQHVNKVSSKVELTFNLDTSQVLSERHKAILKVKLQSKLTKDHTLIMQCGESRSQHKNKELIVKRFLELIKEALVVPKKRVPTKTPKAIKAKRLKAKSVLSEKKAKRKKPEIE